MMVNIFLCLCPIDGFLFSYVMATHGFLLNFQIMLIISITAMFYGIVIYRDGGKDCLARVLQGD